MLNDRLKWVSSNLNLFFQNFCKLCWTLWGYGRNLSACPGAGVLGLGVVEDLGPGLRGLQGQVCVGGAGEGGGGARPVPGDRLSSSSSSSSSSVPGDRGGQQTQSPQTLGAGLGGVHCACVTWVTWRRVTRDTWRAPGWPGSNSAIIWVEKHDLGKPSLIINHGDVETESCHHKYQKYKLFRKLIIGCHAQKMCHFYNYGQSYWASKMRVNLWMCKSSKEGKAHNKTAKSLV